MTTVCENCEEAIATVHLTEIVSNDKKEIHLCEACAQQKGVAIQSHMKNISIPEFFGQIVDPKQSYDESEDSLHCPSCGLSYRQFRSSGKLGCPDDYSAFRGELSRLLEKIHSSAQHRGKVPSRVGVVMHRQKELEELRIELQGAVKSEEYELAATLRDRISELEQEEHCS